MALFSRKKLSTPVRTAQTGREEARLNLLAKLKALPGMTNINKSTGWPSMPLEALSEHAVWAGFTAIAEQVQGLIKRGLTASDSQQE